MKFQPSLKLHAYIYTSLIVTQLSRTAFYFIIYLQVTRFFVHIECQLQNCQLANRCYPKMFSCKWNEDLMLSMIYLNSHFLGYCNFTSDLSYYCSRSFCFYASEHAIPLGTLGFQEEYLAKVWGFESNSWAKIVNLTEWRVCYPDPKPKMLLNNV